MSTYEILLWLDLFKSNHHSNLMWCSYVIWTFHAQRRIACSISRAEGRRQRARGKYTTLYLRCPSTVWSTCGNQNVERSFDLNHGAWLGFRQGCSVGAQAAQLQQYASPVVHFLPDWEMISASRLLRRIKDIRGQPVFSLADLVE